MASPISLIILVLIVTLVFSVFGLVSFIQTPPSPPSLVAGDGIIISNGTISMDMSMYGDSSSIGELFGYNISNPTEIVITGISNGTSEMVEVIIPTSVTGVAVNMNQLSNGRFQYLGSRDGLCHTATTITMAGASSDQTFALMLGINGTLKQNSLLLQHIGTGGDIQTVAMHTYVILSPYDYISLFVGNIQSISSFNIYTLNMFIMCMNPNM